MVQFNRLSLCIYLFPIFLLYFSVIRCCISFSHVLHLYEKFHYGSVMYPTTNALASLTMPSSQQRDQSLPKPLKGAPLLLLIVSTKAIVPIPKTHVASTESAVETAMLCRQQDCGCNNNNDVIDYPFLYFNAHSPYTFHDEDGHH